MFATMALHTGEVLVQLPSRGLGGWMIPSFEPLGLVWSWLQALMVSLTTIWVWPFLLLEFWILVRLRAGEDRFPLLLSLAIAQSIHSFIVLSQIKFRVAVELIAGGGVLLVSLVAMTSLTLWWRHLLQNAPEPIEEPEL